VTPEMVAATKTTIMIQATDRIGAPPFAYPTSVCHSMYSEKTRSVPNVQRG
jgi:hypothetical protein